MLRQLDEIGFSCMIDPEPLISVIIPTYNGAGFIERTILSVLGQTYTRFELLVVDDGSQDATGEIVQSISARDGRVKYFYQHNSGGPAQPTNYGIRQSMGRWLAFLDHDDIWLPEKLAMQVQYLQRHPVDMVTCHTLVCWETDRGRATNIRVPGSKNYARLILEKNFILSTSSVLVRAEVAKTVGLFDEQLIGPQDWDFYIRVLTGGYSFGVVNNFLYIHVLSEKNISASINPDMYEAQRVYLFNKYRHLYTRKDVYSNYLRSVGVQYAAFGLSARARKFFWMSIKANYFNFRSLAYCGLSLGGGWLFRRLISGKNWLMSHTRR